MTGRTPGHYRVDEQLGRKSIGEVYRLNDLSLAKVTLPRISAFFSRERLFRALDGKTIPIRRENKVQGTTTTYTAVKQ